MRLIFDIIHVILVLSAWLFPVIISFATCNFWYILLYIVWWIPAAIITGFINITHKTLLP